MKFAVAVALCCAAQVLGLGMPNNLLPQATFSTVPPWQWTMGPGYTALTINSNTPLSAVPGIFVPITFVVPPTFTQGAKQYRRVYDWQTEASYIPLNNYVLLTNADLSSVTPRAKVLALGPTVTRLNTTNIGSTVAHPALSNDAFGYTTSSFTSGTNTVVGSFFNPSNWVVAKGTSYAWTGGSLDWNMFILSSHDQVFDSAWLTKLNNADQNTAGKVGALVGNDYTVDVYANVSPNDPNTWKQRWIRSSPQSDGLYFLQDTSLLGIVSVQNGDQTLFAKDRKTHIAYGGYRPNHLLNSGCDRQNRINPTDPPAFFGNC